MKRPNPLMIMASAAILGGCAAQPAKPTIAELRVDVGSALFIQHGHEPLSYAFGIVDGKSMYAQALAGGLVGNIAQAKVDAERDQVTDTLRGLMEGTHYVDLLVEGIMPTIAEQWQVSYLNERPVVLPLDGEPMLDDNGRFIADAHDADLVVMTSITLVKLDEAFTGGNLAKAMFAAGIGARAVRPTPVFGVTVFRRSPEDGAYEAVWNHECAGLTLSGPAATIQQMQESRDKAIEVFRENAPRAVEFCAKQLKMQS